jgi:hypothetical protein
VGPAKDSDARKRHDVTRDQDKKKLTKSQHHSTQKFEGADGGRGNYMHETFNGLLPGGLVAKSPARVAAKVAMFAGPVWD